MIRAGDYSPAIVLLMGDDGDYSPAIVLLITVEMRRDMITNIVCRCNIWVWCSDPAKCGKQCWLKRAGSADAIQAHGKGEGET